MGVVHITINGMPYEVLDTYTILEAAREVGIKIPTLCFLKDLNETGACRVCVVEVKGARSLVTACNMKVQEGMEILTHSKRVLDSRKMTVELLLANHNVECTTCIRNHSCELKQLSNDLNCKGDRFKGDRRETIYRDDSYSIVRDTSKCILCGRCVAACREKAGVEVLAFNQRGFKTYIGPAFETCMDKAGCIHCGQCIAACPTAALSEHSNIEEVVQAINDPSKVVVFQVAPAVRAALGEEFGLPLGTCVTGKIAAVVSSFLDKATLIGLPLASSPITILGRLLSTVPPLPEYLAFLVLRVPVIVFFVKLSGTTSLLNIAAVAL